MPAALRLPLLLCCLQGQTRDEAAEALGCTVAAVKSRLERGRDLLRQRLQKRGVELPAAFLALSLTGGNIRAALLSKTAQAALQAPTAAVAALADAGVSGMALGGYKLILAALLLVSSVAGAAGLLRTTRAADPPRRPASKEHRSAEPKAATAPPVRVDSHGDPLPDGAIARLGTVRWRHGNQIAALVYSPDGKKIAAGGFGAAVTLWDASSGKLLHKFPQQIQSSGGAFSPDGTMLATADKDGCFLWDVATGKRLRLLKGEGLILEKVVFAPDGKSVAGANRKGSLCLWDTATGALLRSIKCSEDITSEVVFSPDGKRLASGGIDGTINLFDALTGKELHRWQAQQRWVRALFTPDGKRLLSSGFSLKETIHEWDVATGREIRTFGELRRGRLPIALSKDGSLLASGEVDGQIRLWDMATGQEKRHWSAGSTPLWDVAFAPDGKTLASTARTDCSIRLWDVATGQERQPSQEHLGGIPVLRFLADAKTLLSVSPDRRMLWWDVTEQRPSRQFTWTAPERTAWSPCRPMAPFWPTPVSWT